MNYEASKILTLLSDKIMKYVLQILMFTMLGFVISSCGNSEASMDSGGKQDSTTVKKVHTLPQRKAKVYIGISGGWHAMAKPDNYSKWNYVRTHADGFYTNFIAMWKNYYQNSKDPQQSCNNIAMAFRKKGTFFETSMETKVNDGPNGANNAQTDKKYIDCLQTGGFNVDYSSLNYGISKDRVKLLQSYNGNREVLTLVGPWTIGGNIASNEGDNKQLRKNIKATDGMETDGPLGYWYANFNHMKQGSYSLVKYAGQVDETSAVMLAPYSAQVDGYTPKQDYFRTSKQAVFDHEDHNAAPDIWTIWTYMPGDEPMPTFPESMVNAKGDTVAANTKMGVGYWLIKHLNTFPALDFDNASVEGNNIKITKNKQKVTAKIDKGSSMDNHSFPVTVSNALDPNLSISPVIRAVIDNHDDWEISFSMNGKNVTDAVIYKGGLNFVGDRRLTLENNKRVLKMDIKAKTANPSPTTIKFKTMSNISNTANVKYGLSITVQAS